MFFGPNFQKKGVIMGYAQIEELFFPEITKADHNLSETFNLIKISCLD